MPIPNFIHKYQFEFPRRTDNMTVDYPDLEGGPGFKVFGNSNLPIDQLTRGYGGLMDHYVENSRLVFEDDKPNHNETSLIMPGLLLTSVSSWSYEKEEELTYWRLRIQTYEMDETRIRKEVQKIERILREP